MSDLLRIMHWHPCHGSRELLRDGWPGAGAYVARHAARARAAGVTLSGFCHDNPFQKHINELSSNPNAPTTCFDQWVRCRETRNKTAQMIASVPGWLAGNNVIHRAYRDNGHGDAFEVYIGPPAVGIECNDIADAMLPFLCGRRPFVWNDGSADFEREHSDYNVISFMRSIGLVAGVEALPLEHSVFNRPHTRAFATYMVAHDKPAIQCPISLLYRGATEEAPTFPNGSRGDPVPLETAIAWCKEKNATLHVNIGLCDARTLAIIAGAQAGVSTPQNPVPPVDPA